MWFWHVCLALECLVTVASTLQPDVIQFGKYLSTDPMRTFQHTSHYRCYQECLMRSACKSYSYMSKTLSCEISKFDHTTNNLLDQKTAIYSAKTDWTQTMLDPQCSACNDTTACSLLENGEIICTPMECMNPPEQINRTQILGNLNHFGATRKYVCQDSYRYVGGTAESVCQDNGSWSPASMECVHMCYIVTPPDANMIVYNVTYDEITENYHIQLQCKTGFIFRGLSIQLQCNKNTGTYMFKKVCCDIPDVAGEMRIFRLVSYRSYGGLMNFFINSDPTNAYRVDCQFQHTDIITSWDTTSFSQIRVEIFANGNVVAWMNFQAQNTDRINWFSHTNLLDSSWTDLNTNLAPNYFSISSSNTFHYNESTDYFPYIVMEQVDLLNCADTHGWLMITFSKVCAPTATGANIFYAPGNVKASGWENFLIADKMEFSVI